MLNRLKRPVYYCYRLRKQDEGYQEGIETFRPPVKRILNILPISGEAIIASGGELSKQTMVARLPVNHPDRYFENDRLYIGIDSPAEFDPADPKANYRIVSVLIGHSVTEIVIEKLL